MMNTSDEVQAAPSEAARSAVAPVRWWQSASHWQRVSFVAGLGVITLCVALWAEARTSWLQSRVLSSVAEDLTYQVADGPSSQIWYPSHGPYNERLGYTRIPALLDSISGRSFEVEAQVRLSDAFVEALDVGLFPIYRQKDQTGLAIVDRAGASIFEAAYPSRVYPSFEAIPPLVWQTLLFIENRELFDVEHPFHNPAIEWDRFAGAVGQQAAKKLGIQEQGFGGSTLATQLEKIWHSPEGRTTSGRDKLRQMASASVRSYMDGPRTAERRKEIVRAYLNVLPLSAIAGHGEVNGLGDGLWAWYGTELSEVEDLLADAPDETRLTDQARVYRQVLSLILATRSPSRFLRSTEGRVALHRLTDEHLRLMAAEGVIDAKLAQAALGVTIMPRMEVTRPAQESFIARKAANATRADLLGLYGFSQLSGLDRFDLTVQTTYDRQVQRDVVRVLEQLHDPVYIREAGLNAYRLLAQGDPANVTYAVVLYEVGDGANLIRVQADNFDGPFDVNRQSKLELGSTAKLRTLVTYLQLAEQLHDTYGGMSADQLRAVDVPSYDRLTAWAVDYMRRNPNATREDILAAAMDRRYSASPAERFFTGGGLHTFNNFSADDNSRVVTVWQAMRNSINLPFIRMMRDIVQYHVARLPGNPAAMLDDPADPRRQAYLARFAGQEGGQFLRQFRRAYTGKTGDDMWQTLMERHDLTPLRWAWTVRSVEPSISERTFADLMQWHPGVQSGAATPASLYSKTSNAGDLSWQDRGYLARVHPLELWLIQYLRAHPGATWSGIDEASREVRQEVYQWLLKRSTSAQNQRIRTLLEQEAFEGIHAMWQAVGYPFGRLVPTYATSIGSSADRPGALAELVGIVLRDGWYYPTRRIEAMHVAEGTPYETLLRAKSEEPRQVLSAEVAATVRAAMIDVVANGTAVRARGAVVDSTGQALTIGGKTGTGDNRIRVVRAGGTRSSIALNRTSTFVFFIGDRFYGTITAYVPGPEAARYGFTSSLPAQILKIIGPSMHPLLRQAIHEEPDPIRLSTNTAS